MNTCEKLIYKVNFLARMHCPPAWSTEALDVAARAGYREGRDDGREEALFAMQQVLADQGIHVEFGFEKMTTEEPVNDNSERPTQVVYTSLDGSETLSTRELLRFFMKGNGHNPEKAMENIAVKAALIVTRSEESPVTLEQVEYLRKVLVAMEVFEIPSEVFCTAGQDIIAKMQTIVEKYERED